MFKNLTLFRISPEWSTNIEQAESNLDWQRFSPCGATQPISAGWIEPRGHAGGTLLESVAAQWLAKLMIEQKVLPADVVKRRVAEISAAIEKDTGRKPGRKQSKELKEQATLELLPAAFTKQSTVLVWIDRHARLLAIDTGSLSRADDVVSMLARTLPGFALSTIQTAASPRLAMAQWLNSGEPPAGFTIDRDCELKSTDELKSVVRYGRHGLDIDEVRQHIQQGKLPTRLALTWRGRVSFVLTDALQIKKITFLDGVYEGQRVKAPVDEFDADAAIATGELSQLIPELISAMGGEQPTLSHPGAHHV